MSLEKKIDAKLAKLDEALQKARLLESVIEELAARVNAVYFGIKQMQESIDGGEDATKRHSERNH